MATILSSTMLHTTLFGFTCWLVRNWTNFLISTRAEKNSSLFSSSPENKWQFEYANSEKSDTHYCSIYVLSLYSKMLSIWQYMAKFPACWISTTYKHIFWMSALWNSRLTHARTHENVATWSPNGYELSVFALNEFVMFF